MEGEVFELIVRFVVFKNFIDDFVREGFRLLLIGIYIIVGFVFFFLNYFMFLVKGGYYIEDLYVWKLYWGIGLGMILLKSVV